MRSFSQSESTSAVKSTSLEGTKSQSATPSRKPQDSGPYQPTSTHVQSRAMSLVAPYRLNTFRTGKDPTSCHKTRIPTTFFLYFTLLVKFPFLLFYSLLHSFFLLSLSDFFLTSFTFFLSFFFEKTFSRFTIYVLRFTFHLFTFTFHLFTFDFFIS